MPQREKSPNRPVFDVPLRTCLVFPTVKPNKSVHKFENYTLVQAMITHTSLNGLIFVCMIKGYLQSSQFFMSELWTHRCKHPWCTYFSEPAQQQGATNGASNSASQWQILWIKISLEKEMNHVMWHTYTNLQISWDVIDPFLDNVLAADNSGEFGFSSCVH